MRSLGVEEQFYILWPFFVSIVVWISFRILVIHKQTTSHHVFTNFLKMRSGRKSRFRWCSSAPVMEHRLYHVETIHIQMIWVSYCPRSLKTYFIRQTGHNLYGQVRKAVTMDPIQNAAIDTLTTLVNIKLGKMLIAWFPRFRIDRAGLLKAGMRAFVAPIKSEGVELDPYRMIDGNPSCAAFNLPK